MDFDLYRFTDKHEWIRLEGEVGTVGITDYAQEQLGDVVTVELPEVGRTVEQDESIALIDSMKSTSDIYSPVSGEIVEVNESLLEHPELMNQSPYEGGWIFKIKLSRKEEFDSLMTKEQYDAFVEKEGQ